MPEQLNRFHALRNPPARHARDAPFLAKLARQLIACCEDAQVVEDHDANVRITEKRCRSRVCVRCAKLRQRELLAKLAPLVKEFDSPKLITLTVRSDANTDLRSQIKRVSSLFRRLRSLPFWKERVAGGFWGIEATFSAKNGWHPHIHAVVEANFVPWQQLRNAWEALVNDHAGVDIRAVRSRNAAAKYVAEYVSKSSNLEALPRDRLCEWAIAVHGLRLVQTFGHLHRLRIPAEAKPDYSYKRVLYPVNELTSRAAYGNQRCETTIQVISKLSGADDRLPRHAHDRLLGARLLFQLGIGPRPQPEQPWLNASPSIAPSRPPPD